MTSELAMHPTAVAICTWALTVAAVDLRRRRIPNALSLGAIGVAALLLLIYGSSATGGSAGSALGAAALGLVLTLPGYATGAVGAGDVKLAMAIGVLTDLEFFIAGFVLAGVLAGVWALAWLWLAYSGRLPIATGAGPTSQANSIKPVPFGAALGIAAVMTVLLREFAHVI